MHNNKNIKIASVSSGMLSVERCAHGFSTTIKATKIINKKKQWSKEEEMRKEKKKKRMHFTTVTP